MVKSGFTNGTTWYITSWRKTIAPRQKNKSPNLTQYLDVVSSWLEIEGLEKPINMSKRSDQYTMWIIVEFKCKINGYNDSCDNWKFWNKLGDGGIIFLGMIILCRTVLIFEILGMKLCNTTFTWLSKIYNTGRKKAKLT